jgi:GT2 family glycosyltransferase
MTAAPRFSIVIPTFNRPAQLARCIESIGKLETPGNWVEIIVVNDGGEAPDEAQLLSLARGIEMQIISQSRRGPGAARNRGVANARGEHIAFLDDDCHLPADWCNVLSSAVHEAGNCMIGGHTLNHLESNLLSEASQTLVDYVYGYYNDPDANRTPLFTSNNMIVPAMTFRALGGFDESFRTAEDRELCRRWHERGLRIVFDPALVVLHAHRLSLQSLLRQHFSYGRGALAYWQKKSAALRDLKIEPLRFYVGMLSFPFKARRRHAPLLSLLIGITQVANAAGFAFAAAQRFRLRQRAPVLREKAEPVL